MKVAIKLLGVATALLFVTEPMAFGQNGSTPPRPTDISGYWLMEFGTCKGSISISPPLNSVGDRWNGGWIGLCGSDALQVQYIISVSSHTEISPNQEIHVYEEYNFSGSGSFSDGVVVVENYNFDWSTNRETLGGSGFITIGSNAQRSVSVSMHKLKK